MNFYVHGTAFAAWMVLLVVQTRLVAAGRTDVHRKLGVFGAVLAAAMVVLGTVGALTAAGRATGFVGIPVPRLQFLAILKRRDLQSHKRLMVIATVNLITAGWARWPGVNTLGPLAYFGLTDLFLVALVIWDLRTLGRPHPVTLWGGLLLFLSRPLRLMVSGTAAWLTFAAWAVGLVR